MLTPLHWIDLALAGRLAIAARPRAGDWLSDEIAGWRAAGVDRVASLLEPAEVADLGLQDEPRLCREHGIAFMSFPIPDRGVPQSRRDAVTVAQTLAGALQAGQTIAVHCRAGIGRSSLVAACVLVHLRIDPGAALDRIGKARGLSVPDTPAQRDWIFAFREGDA